MAAAGQVAQHSVSGACTLWRTHSCVQRSHSC